MWLIGIAISGGGHIHLTSLLLCWVSYTYIRYQWYICQLDFSFFNNIGTIAMSTWPPSSYVECHTNMQESMICHIHPFHPLHQGLFFQQYWMMFSWKLLALRRSIILLSIFSPNSPELSISSNLPHSLNSPPVHFSFLSQQYYKLFS